MQTSTFADECAGTVKQVGRDVQSLSPRDEIYCPVFGSCGNRAMVPASWCQLMSSEDSYAVRKTDDARSLKSAEEFIGNVDNVRGFLHGTIRIVRSCKCQALGGKSCALTSLILLTPVRLYLSSFQQAA